jgi:hypothetical protein
MQKRRRSYQRPTYQLYVDADVGLFAKASGAGIDEEGKYNQRM